MSVDANIPLPCRQGKRACSIAIAQRSAALLPSMALKYPIFGMLGHILDSLIT
jgi:hypothetical protein